VRNDTRSLLRSRPLQGVLAVVAGLQVVAVAGGSTAQRQTGPGVVRQAMAAPVVVRAPAAVVQAPVKVAAKPKAAKKTKADAKLAQVEALAARYRKAGYKVSPALARQIHAAATANRIDPLVAFGLVRTESGFKNSATSPVGAVGLTQLMPSTARFIKRGVTRSDLRNPEVNLSIGFRYLRDLIEKYDGDTELALTAYNRGPGTVDRVLKRGGDPDNGYAGMVLGRDLSFAACFVPANWHPQPQSHTEPRSATSSGELRPVAHHPSVTSVTSVPSA
jgi:soluble lytic murein transglycosylase-like protein